MKHVNQTVGVSNVGSYFFAFDALYKIWLAQERIDKEDEISLVTTIRGKVGRRVAKLVVTIATLGTLEVFGSLPEIAQLVQDLSAGAQAFDAGREQLVDAVFEERITDVQSFIHRFVAPRLNRRLRAAIGESVLDTSNVSMVMQELLIEAVSRTQASIKDRGLLMLVADAIDEVEDSDSNSVRLRFAVSELLIYSMADEISGVICGRAPAVMWLKEVEGQPKHVESLADLTDRDVRTAFKFAGIDAAKIDEVLAEAGSPKPIHAGALSEACKRLAITWPAR